MILGVVETKRNVKVATDWLEMLPELKVESGEVDGFMIYEELALRAVC